MLLESAYEDWRFDKSLDQKRRSATHNMICVPIGVGEQCLGCLEVANKRIGSYNKHDYELAVAVARELALGFAVQVKASEDAEDGRVSQIANENLLSPLLRNVLKILLEILKCEK